MTDPTTSIKKIIDESLQPRLDSFYAHLAAAQPDPLYLGKADLLYLWDDYGNELLDFDAVFNPAGHRHNVVIGALSEHLRYYVSTSPQGRHLTRWPVVYAKSLSQSLPGPTEGRKVLFCEGEREAVWQAVRRASGDRPAAVLDTGWHRWLPAGQTETVALSVPGALDPKRHGALLLSPVTTDVIPVPALTEWVAAARAYDLPVIVDESVTGFGRLGTRWGQEQAGIVPDLTVLGGPCGGGLPLGAIIGPDRFFVDQDVSAQSGNSLSCAAGSSLLAVIDNGVLPHVEDSSQVMTDALTEVVGQFPGLLAGHHGTGLLRGLRFRDPDLAAAFPMSAREHGLHVGPPVNGTIVLAPPLVASVYEVTRGVDLIADTLLSWDDKGFV